jgi:hypothetical protein
LVAHGRNSKPHLATKNKTNHISICSGLLMWIKMHLLEVNVGFNKETKVIQVANLLQDKGLANMTHVSLQL